MSENQIALAGSCGTCNADVDRVTILAHDVRNYLAPAYMHLTAIRRRAQHERREVDIQAAARGQQALDHAFALMESLLDAARIERGLLDLHLQPLNLNLFVLEAVGLFESDDRVITVGGAGNIIVPADHARLGQVVHNLLANALTHSPPHAPINLEMTTEDCAPGGWAVLTIRNAGPGIPPHMVPQIFQRFSAGPESRGIGLGLYLAHGIVTAHGGTLTATSDPDTGTCFTVRLPLHQRPA